VGEVIIADLNSFIGGNALLYDIKCVKKSMVAKSVYGSSYIKETALF
jgi:hypothetical protein